MSSEGLEKLLSLSNVATTDPQQWKLAAEVHENHGELEKALHCWCTALKLSCAEGKEVSLYGNCLVSSGCKLIHPPESFYKQDLLTQLYALGCGFHRNQMISSAISTLETAVELYNFYIQAQNEENLNTDEMLLMKIYFELACAKEISHQFDSCIIDYRTSLLLAVHNNDVSFEKMILLRFCAVLLQKELFLEAASGYVRLLSIKSDIKKTLNDDTLKFKAHWTQQCDCEIRYGLCVAYKALRLYDRALEEGRKFKHLITYNVTVCKPKLRNRDFMTHTMEINSILGELYEALNDMTSSLLLYQEWLEEVKEVAATKSGPALQVELANAFESVGRANVKLKNYGDAEECFATLAKIGQLSDVPAMTINGMIFEGDVLLARGDCDGARNVFGRALRLSQAIPEDSFELECRCMAKEAEVFAKERRYSHALYRSEQAVTLGRKLTQNFPMGEIERQTALYSQHSTSEKELLAALKFLLGEVVGLESELEILRSEGVEHLHSEEKMLREDYTAVQVILHKLGEHKLSLAFGECWKGRKMNKARKQPPRIPRVQLKEVQCVEAEGPVQLVDADLLLGRGNDRTLLAYSVTDGGLLIHVHNPELNLTHGYLSSDHVVDPHLIEVKLVSLVELVHGKGRPTETLQLMYNKENRCLPGFSAIAMHPVAAAAKDRPKEVDGAGDCAPHGGGAANVGVGNLDQGDVAEVQKAGEPVESKDLSPLTELYKLLVQPVETALKSLPDKSSISVCLDELLAKVPFDHLVNPVDGKPLAEKFNVIATTSLVSHAESVSAGGFPRKKQASRRDELERSFDDPADLVVLEQVGMDKNFSGLVSVTASGTNIVSSSGYLAPYKQAAYLDKACVIGSPDVTKSVQLSGRTWKPQARLAVAQKECKQVAEYLGVSPIMGKDATKSEFLKQMREATVVHVATYGLFEKGILAFCPDNFPVEKEPVSMQRFLVTMHDLVDVRIQGVKLVVLSSGQGWSRTSAQSESAQLDLPTVLLTAGVGAVVFPLWSVPDNVTETFHFHFYRGLQSGSALSRALYLAKAATKRKHPNPLYWNAFTALGSDAIVNLSEIRGSEIHQSISGVEANKLSASTIVKSEQSLAESYWCVQTCLSRLAGNLDVSRDADVIPFLLGLLEEATDRLTKDENSDRAIIILPRAVEDIGGATELLGMVGFDFQDVSMASLPANTRSSFPGESRGDARMVVFPHWNQDGMLLPVHQALSGLLEFCHSEDALRAVSLLLPITDQVLLCRLVDFLAVLHHTPQVQMRITDQSASSLWAVTNIREFLNSVGVTNIRSLVVFYKTIKNKSLLMSALQLLLAVCQHRGGEILEELHVETLGTMPSESEPPTKVLESFSAVVMPRNEILVTSSWSGGNGHVVEGRNRKSLASDIVDVTHKYDRLLEHARWWHQDLKMPRQLSRTLSSEDKKSPRKVKVQSGSTPSCNRIPLTAESASVSPNLFEVLRRREEARNVLHMRCVEVKQRRDSALRSSYLPFVKPDHK